MNQLITYHSWVKAHSEEQILLAPFNPPPPPHLLLSCHQAQLLSLLWNEQQQSCILVLSHEEKPSKFLELNVALMLQFCLMSNKTGIEWNLTPLVLDGIGFRSYTMELLRVLGDRQVWVLFKSFLLRSESFLFLALW